MKNITLNELTNHLTTKEWQTIAIAMQDVEIYKKLTLRDYHTVLGFTPIFFCLLKEEICGKVLTEELDEIFTDIIAKIQAPTINHIMQPVIDDFIKHIASGRQTPLALHKLQKYNSYDADLPYTEKGDTFSLLKQIDDNGVCFEQGIGCFILNGENYIVYKLLNDIAQKNWTGVFNSFAFKNNPEEALKTLDNGTNTNRRPAYSPNEMTFTAPLIKCPSLERLFINKVLH